MKALAVALLLVITVSPAVTVPVFPSRPEEDIGRSGLSGEYREYEDIILSFSIEHPDTGKTWNEDVLAYIKRYGDIIERYPTSPLVPTITLRIAELFSLLTSTTLDQYLQEQRKKYAEQHPGATAEELLAYDQLLQNEIPMEVINEDFRASLGRWLDVVIERYPTARHYSFDNYRFAYDDERVAALALYYRGLFFKANREVDWNRVQKEYPES